MYINNHDEAREYMLEKNAAWVAVCATTGNWLDAGNKTEFFKDPGYPAIVYLEENLAKNMALPRDYKPSIRSVRLKPEQAVKGASGAETSKARESVYGPFHVHAKAEQDMKKAMTSQPGWDKLNDVQKSAAEMIVHKLARILNGSADYDDNWHDISGYATLAEQEIHNRTKPD